MSYRAGYFLVFLFSFVKGAFAQEYSYAHYDTREGLAGSVVYCMAQDKDGFIWFGTETGLSRFDGTSFKKFTIADGLPDNEIIKLFVDSKNRVWIMPFKNSLCYYWRGKIYTAENDSLLKKLTIIGEAFSIIENSEGELVVLETAKLHIIKPDGRIVVVDNYRNDRLSGVLAGGLRTSRTFQFGMSFFQAGFNVFELKGDSLEKKENVNAFNQVNHNSLYLSPDLIIIRGKGVLEFDLLQAGKKYSIDFPDGFLSINRLNDSLIAITSTNSVQTYNIKQQKEDRVFLKGKSISAVMEDREGNLWFTSMGEGIFKLASSEFKSYFLLHESNPLPIITIKKYGDTIYIGTDHFLLWTLDVKTQRFSRQKISAGVSQGRLMSIDKTKKNELVIGTDDDLYLKSSNGIKPFRISTYYFYDSTVIYPLPSKLFKAVKSTYLYGDTIVAGTNEGVYFLYGKNMCTLDLVWQGRVSSLCNYDSNIYVGTLNGLLVLTPDGTPRFLSNVHPSLGTRVSMIKTSADSSIWVATSGKGVVAYKNDRVIAQITEENGLTSNICRSLFVADSILWVGTDKGLNKIRIADLHVTTFTVEDGLVSDIINTVVVDKSQVYVGTPAGITYFDESRAKENSMCVLRLTAIRSGNREWNFDTSNLHFGHYENSIRFEFAGISFKSAGEITYNYRLSGLSETWQQTQDNFLHYPALPSGDYELQLIATNKFGVKSSMVTTRFTIEKLLWEKLWFQGLLVLFVGAGIWMLVTTRIKRIRRAEKTKTETNRKITELEQMALKSQMNPHFIFNSLNAIQQYVIDKDILGANKFITDFSRLIRSTLDISSRLKISLEEEVNYISTYLELEKLRFEGKFNYIVNIIGDIDSSNTYIPPMILQPYVENSIRHGVRYLDGDDGVIKIEFREKESFLLCIIEDNGIGREASRKYKGNMNIEYQSKGMRLTAERIAMMNKNTETQVYIDIEDLQGADSKPRGTRIMIQFPLAEAKKPH